MKATSVQNIKNVNDVCFSIENYPAEMESKLTIVASTNDDIFAFEFEGPDLLRSCKTAGLFTGWEKDQKIGELEKENKRMEENLNSQHEMIKELNQKNLKLMEENEQKISGLMEELGSWKKETAECLILRDRAVEEAKEFKKQLNQEKAANNAYHRFFKKYAGEGTELELTYISGSRNNADVETEYMIIDKEEYKKEEQERMELRKNFIKEVERCTKLRSEIIELEKLKTPTIENFEEPSDNVNHPSHYTGKYECIDVMQDVFGNEATDNFCLCNAFKYIWRARKKNGLEDVKKAVWYLTRYIEEAENGVRKGEQV